MASTGCQTAPGWPEIWVVLDISPVFHSQYTTHVEDVYNEYTTTIRIQQTVMRWFLVQIFAHDTKKQTKQQAIWLHWQPLWAWLTLSITYRPHLQLPISLIILFIYRAAAQWHTSWPADTVLGRAREFYGVVNRRMVAHWQCIARRVAVALFLRLSFINSDSECKL